MGFLNIFSGKTPEELEQKGDLYVENGEYGLAILEYEKAQDRLEKKPSDAPEYKDQLDKKVINTKESLARLHFENGNKLVASEVFDEAEELFDLAAGLTKEKELVSKIEKKRNEIKNTLKEEAKIEQVVVKREEGEKEEFVHSEDEHFGAIVSSLPPEENKAYQSYGDNFKTGYVALHNADFKTAVERLSFALDENPDEKSFIALELATAKTNLGLHDEALTLLEQFILQHPGSTRAYTIICEILWERGDFEKVQKLLYECIPEISGSVPMKILQGETFFNQKKFDEAVEIYNKVLDEQGWDEHIARFLAKTYEASGSNEAARDMYGEILGKCQGCGKRPDPYIMFHYAETSFAAGDYSKGILEIYLNLSKTDTDNQKHCFKRISEIYSSQGNDKEARRFSDFVDSGV